MLRIQREPRARAGLALAREILAAHGLEPVQAAPGVFAIVARTSAASEPAASAQASNDATIEEVVVQTSRYALHAEAGASEAFLTQEETHSMPRLADEPLRSVQRLPGVASNGFSGLGAVRGGEPNETALMLDGLRLYEPFHLKNFLSPVSLLDSRLIASMDVHSGGFPVLYGDRMSSIIEARSVRPEQARYYEAFLSLFHAGALASAAFADDRGRALLSVRRSNIGDLAHYAENDFGEPQYADGFLRLDYEFDDATQGALSALLSQDRIKAVRDSGRERAHAEYRNSYLWASLERAWSERFETRAIASYTDVDNDRRGQVDAPGQRIATVSDERVFHIVGLRLDNELDAAPIQQRFGLEARSLRGRYDYASDVRFEAGFPFPGSPPMRVQRTAAPRPRGSEAGAYWDGRVELGRRWTVQAGLRFDAQSFEGVADATQWSPRLNVLYALSDATRLRASWGRFYQPQGVNELQVEDGVERFYGPQHADHAILSIDHAFAAGFDVRIEAYRKFYRRLRPRFENLLDPLVLLPETELDRVMIDPDSARAEGVEALLRMQPRGGWSGWIAYAWSRAEDRIDGRDAARSWDQTHAINLGLSWVSGPWAVTLVNSFHTGWPTTTMQLTTDANGAVRAVPGSRNAARLAYYNSLDLRATRTFALPRGALDVYAEVSNALSRDNPCCVEYSTAANPDGSLRLQQEVDAWLPLVPSIGVLWRY